MRRLQQATLLDGMPQSAGCHGGLGTVASGAGDVGAELDWTAQLLSKAQTQVGALDGGGS
jgi:hypothetical protein